MVKKLGHISGAAYRTRDGVDGVRFEARDKDLFVGQRDPSQASQASILLGKVVERASASDLFDANTWLDVSFPHVVFVSGRRGSGKSYDLGIIAEGLSAEPGSNFSRVSGGFCTILFDIQSQFWTMGRKLLPDNLADQEQARMVTQWNLDGSVSDPQLFLPAGSQKITGTETRFVISPSSLEIGDWLALINADRFDPMGQLLRNCIEIASLQNAGLTLDDLVAVLRGRNAHQDLARFQQSTADALEWRILALKDLELFRPGDDLTGLLLKISRVSIVLLRELEDTVRSVVVAVTMRHVERAMSRYHQQLKVASRGGVSATGSQLPSRVWILIDEAHLVCPTERKTPANDVIIDYVKRGRDAGLSLVLATQQPSALDSAAISQVDLSLIHRMTFEADINAALQRLPSPLPRDIALGGKDISDPRLLIRRLAPGECIVSDAEASRSFIMRSRPRVSPHGGGEPLLQ